MIPKILHTTWCGEGSPSTHCLASWLKLNPDVEHRHWSDGEGGLLPGDMLRPITLRGHRLKRGITRSDYLRLRAVYKHGGIYVDNDMRALQPMPRAVWASEGFVVRHPGESKLICNGIFGFAPKHPIVAAALEIFRREIRLRRAPQYFGPALLSRAFHLVSLQGIIVMPAHSFFPVSRTNRNQASSATLEDYPESLGVHEWEHSWKSQAKIKKA